MKENLETRLYTKVTERKMCNKIRRRRLWQKFLDTNGVRQERDERLKLSCSTKSEKQDLFKEKLTQRLKI